MSVDTRLKENRVSTVTQHAGTEDWSLDLGFEWVCFMWDEQKTALRFPSLSTRIGSAFCLKDRLVQS